MQKYHNMPGPKEEDINTMHRYRDAIVYSADKRAAQGANYPGSFDRTMFGAYVLFPYADEKKYEKHDFYKSIETVNVGGVPFLPSATKMVRDFLEELIADSPESAFERATLPSSIEEKLARVDWSHRDVLIVKVPDQAAMDACLVGTSLSVPESEISMEHLPIHHVALYQPAVGIERFGTVLLTQEDAAGNYIFKVDRWHKLVQPIGVGEFGVGSVAYTNMFLLTHGEKYPDLHIVHFDAHADLRDDYLGARLSHACVMRRCYDILGDDRIHQFCIRSGDREEFRFATMHTELHRFGFDGLEECCEKLAAAKVPVYFTIDLDCLDPSCFPGTGTPEAGGVDFKSLLNAILLTARTNIVAADLNELAPMLDISGISTAAACKALRELLLAIGK